MIVMMMMVVMMVMVAAVAMVVPSVMRIGETRSESDSSGQRQRGKQLLHAKSSRIVGAQGRASLAHARKSTRAVNSLCDLTRPKLCPLPRLRRSAA